MDQNKRFYWFIGTMLRFLSPCWLHWCSWVIGFWGLIAESLDVLFLVGASLCVLRFGVNGTPYFDAALTGVSGFRVAYGHPLRFLTGFSSVLPSEPESFVVGRLVNQPPLPAFALALFGAGLRPGTFGMPVPRPRPVASHFVRPHPFAVDLPE